MDRISKSLDTLKALQAAIVTSSEEKLRRKDANTATRDKINHCRAVVDSLMSQSVKSHADYGKVLSETLETLLTTCNDADGDVRIEADTCINRLIKQTLLESNATRIQVELYKELKKNGPARCVKTALIKFAELAEQIKPQKARLFAVSMVSCVAALAKRPEDDVQSCLGSFIEKVWPHLGRSFTDEETKVLIKAFLPNLQLQSLVSRRTAAFVLVLICRFCRKVETFTNYLLKALLDQIVPIAFDQTANILLGTFFALKQLMPLLKSVEDGDSGACNSGDGGISSATSFVSSAASGVPVRINQVAANPISIDQLLQLYEVSLFYVCYSNVSVATAALESLSALLTNLPNRLLTLLLSSDGIERTRIYASSFPSWAGSASGVHSGIRSRKSSFCGRSGVSSVTGSQPDLTSLTGGICDLAFSDDASSTSTIVGVDLAQRPLSAKERLAASSASDSGMLSSFASLVSSESGIGSVANVVAGEVAQMISPNYGGFEMGEQTTEDGEQGINFLAVGGGSNCTTDLLSHSPETSWRPGQIFFNPDELAPQDQPLGLRKESASKQRPALGGLETLDKLADPLGAWSDPLSPLSPRPQGELTSLPEGIGTLIDPVVSLLYCGRLLCAKFLLAGVDGEVIPDRDVRVSQKAAALSCVTAIVDVYPTFLFQLLFVGGYRQQQPVADLLQYATHADPQLRALVISLCGRFLLASFAKATDLTVLEENFGKLDATFVTNCVDAFIQAPRVLSVDWLCSLTASSFSDQSALVIRSAIGSIEVLVPVLTLYNGGRQLLQLLRRMLELASKHPSFLVKVDVVNLLAKLDYSRLRFLEETCLSDPIIDFLSPPVTFQFQAYALDVLLTQLIGDEDVRVRQPVAEALVEMLPRLCFVPKSDDLHPLLIALSQRELAELTPPQGDEIGWAFDSFPSVHSLVEPFASLGKEKCALDVELNLSFVLRDILARFVTATSRNFQAGCISALFNLSQLYKPTIYRKSWLCFDPKAKLVTKTDGGSNSSSNYTGNTSGMLDLFFSCLTNGPLMFDFAVHEQTLRFLGNVTSGFVICAVQRCSFAGNLSTVVADERFANLCNKGLAGFVYELLFHCLRILNLYWYALNEQVPVGIPAGTSFGTLKQQLQSTLPQASSLPSPVKKRMGIGGGSSKSATQDDLSAVKIASSDASALTSGAAAKSEAIATPAPKNLQADCVGSLQYAKLFELIRSAHATQKESLDSAKSERLVMLLKSALTVLSQILEFSLLTDVAKVAEELLLYLRVCTTLVPVESIQCVQQLLKALFGTNLNFISGEPKNEAGQFILGGESVLAALVKQSEAASGATSLSGKLPFLQKGAKQTLYDAALMRPYGLYAHGLLVAAMRHESIKHSIERHLGWLNLKTDKHVLAMLRSGATKNPLASFIRLFEPVVIQALKLYTNTHDILLQRQVVRLLMQLVQSRVNYCLLDADFRFLQFVYQQLESVEDDHFTRLEPLIPTVFEFFIALSYERYKTQTVVDVSRLFQLFNALLASGHNPSKAVIPALHVVTLDLFLLRPATAKTDVVLQAELETHREVVVSTLLKLLQYGEAVDVMSIVLQQLKTESEEKWRKLSRDVVDVLLPIIGKFQLNFTRNAKCLLPHVSRTLEVVCPSAFRPVDQVLHWAFSPLILSLVQASGHDGEDTLREAILSTFRAKPFSVAEMLASQMLLLRVLVVYAKEEAMLGRLEQMGIRVSTANSQANALQPQEVLARLVITMCEVAVLELWREAHILPNSAARSPSNSALLKIAYEYFTLALATISGNNFKRLTAALTPLLSASRILPKYVFCLAACSERLATSFGILFSHILASANLFALPIWSQRLLRTFEPNCRSLRLCSVMLYSSYLTTYAVEASALSYVVAQLPSIVMDLVDLSNELPICDALPRLNPSTESSIVWLEALKPLVQSKTKNMSLPSARRLLQYLNAIHLNASMALVEFLVDVLVPLPYLAVCALAANSACLRVEQLLIGNAEAARLSATPESIQRLIGALDASRLRQRYLHLRVLLVRLWQSRWPQTPVSALDGGALELTSGGVAEATASQPLAEVATVAIGHKFNKLKFVKVLKDCTSGVCSPHAFARVLCSLHYEETVELLCTAGITHELLEACLEQGLRGLFETLSVNAGSSTMVTPVGSPSSSAALIENYPPLDPIRYPLAAAAKVAILRSLKNLVSKGAMAPLESAVQCERKSVRGCLEPAVAEQIVSHFEEHASSVRLLILNARYLKPLGDSDHRLFVEFACGYAKSVVLSLSYSVGGSSRTSVIALFEFLRTAFAHTALMEKLTALSERGITFQASLISSIYFALRDGFGLASEMEHFEVQHLPSGCELLARECPRQEVIWFQITALLSWLEHRIVCEQRLTERLESREFRFCELPNDVSALFAGVILALCRFPIVSSYCRTPPAVFRYGWTPELKKIQLVSAASDSSAKGQTSGDASSAFSFIFVLPATPVRFLQSNVDVLRQFVQRILVIGWSDRQHFEETWMALVGVLSSTPIGAEELGKEPPAEITERLIASSIAVRCLTSLLLYSLLAPRPGNPSCGYFLLRHREKRTTFLKSRYGKRLLSLKYKISTVLSPSNRQSFNRTILLQKNSVPLFNANVERLHDVGAFSYGQLSLETLWSVTGILAEERKLVAVTSQLPPPTAGPFPPVPLDPSALLSGTPVADGVKPAARTGIDFDNRLSSAYEATTDPDSPFHLPEAALPLVANPLEPPSGQDPLSLALVCQERRRESGAAEDDQVEAAADVILRKPSRDSLKRPENIFSQLLPGRESGASSLLSSGSFGTVSVIDASSTDSAMTQQHLADPTPFVRRSTSGFLLMSDGGLDLLSSLHFLLDHFEHWLKDGPDAVPISLLSATVESMVLLSDVFTERAQYEALWSKLRLLLQQRELAEDVKDDCLMQYIVLGLLKCAAVLGLEDVETKRLLLETLDSCLGDKCPHLSIRISALAGCLYYLQSVTPDENQNIISILAGFLVIHFPLLLVAPDPIVEFDKSRNHKLKLLLLATAFHIAETHQDAATLDWFIARLEETCLKCLTADSDTLPLDIFKAIAYGLQSLLVNTQMSQKFLSQLATILSQKIQATHDSAVTVPAVELLLTCLYVGKSDRSFGESTPEMDSAPPLPERHISAMERLALFLKKISNGLPEEAAVVGAVLPIFLADNFSPSDVINKVISELLSPTQPHPNILAKVLFEVFDTLREMETALMVSDWALLSLPCFTSKTPVNMAIWSLSCFLLGACSNPWVRSFFPIVVERVGKSERFDLDLFCFVIGAFRQQLEDKSQIESLVLTLKDADRKHPNAAYKPALQLLLKF